MGIRAKPPSTRTPAGRNENARAVPFVASVAVPCQLRTQWPRASTTRRSRTAQVASAHSKVNRVAGRGEILRFRGQPLPILRLYELFGAEGAMTDLEKGLLVVVEADGRQVGLFVDDLQGQQLQLKLQSF